MDETGGDIVFLFHTFFFGGGMIILNHDEEILERDVLFFSFWVCDVGRGLRHGLREQKHGQLLDGILGVAR